MASPISSTMARSRCCTTETVTGSIDAIRSSCGSGGRSGDALNECSRIVRARLGIEQERPIDRTKVIHRLDEAVDVLVLERQAQRRKPAPREIDPALQHLEVEQRLQLGVIGDVRRPPDRASMDVDDIERTLPKHLHRHPVPAENGVHPLAQTITARVEVVSG